MKFSYKKLRLALFLLSYSGSFIKNQSLNKQYRKEIPLLAKVLNLDAVLLEDFIYSSKNPKKLLDYQLKLNNNEDKSQILIYLEIEKEISSLLQERSDKNSLVFEDYGRKLLDPAIERVAGDHLSGVDDDFMFDNNLEDLKRRYTKIYYQVAYKYKLPTLRVLPFLLRLIS